MSRFSSQSREELEKRLRAAVRKEVFRMDRGELDPHDAEQVFFAMAWQIGRIAARKPEWFQEES